MTVRVIGVPTDYGGNRRGVDMGPSAIRYAGLVERLDGLVEVVDDGNLLVPRADRRAPTDPDAKHLDAVEEVSVALADRVADTLDAGDRPLVLGGDHSVAIGALGGTARGAEVGLIWFDAHGDINTPATTPSGNVHGMPLAAALGCGAFGDMPWAQASGLAPENVALVGLRDLDDAERERLTDLPVTPFTMADIDDRGMVDVVESAIDVATDGTAGMHVSFDLDLIDPDDAPGVGTPVRGGITYREATTAMEQVARSGPPRSLGFVEVNPVLDEHNRTAELTTELAASALGERIL